MATTWDEKPPTPWFGLLCPVLLLQPPGHVVSMGWLLGKFGGESCSLLGQKHKQDSDFVKTVIL